MVVGGGVALGQHHERHQHGAHPVTVHGHQGERPSGGDRPEADQGTPPARTPHLMGTVKSVSGSTILITDQDGFTRTIKVSSSTKYDDSLTANPAVGTKIGAEGTVDADGTSLDATTVGAAKMPVARWSGRPRRRTRAAVPAQAAPAALTERRTQQRLDREADQLSHDRGGVVPDPAPRRSGGPTKPPSPRT